MELKNVKSSLMSRTFGERLKIARKKAGYSLRGLSDALNGTVSAQAIGKYERGEMLPRSDVLLRLGKVLDVSIGYLLSEQVEALGDVEFRKLSHTTAQERARVSAEVIDRLERHLNIEEILELDDGAWNEPRFGNRFLGEESEAEIVVEDLRKEWRLGIDPIPNMTSLLEDLGIKVFVIELPRGVSGLACSPHWARKNKKIPVVVVNREVTLERRRFTLAHELAHLVIDKGSPVDHEKAANMFAGAFLAPRAHLRKEIGETRKSVGCRELIHLARMYRISAAALLVRLKQVGIIDESTLAYAFRTFARGWRSREPKPVERPGEEGQHELPRRFERLCYRALAEGLISWSKASELLQQPLEQIEQGLRGPAASEADYRM